MRYLLSLLCAPLLACSSSDDATDPLPPPPEGEGFQVSMSLTVPPGTEVWQCQVTELPGPDFIPVNHVVSVQSAGIHHMDIMALAFANVTLEPGTYDCNDIYRDHPELMEDGLILYASQQAEQEITLPEGTIANLPGGLLVMQELHYVNATPSPVEAFSKVNIYRYEGDVEEAIWGLAVRDTELDVPPGQSVEWTRCVMNQDVDVLFLSSHTHELAEKVEVRLFDGAEPGELVYENTDWHAPQLLDFGAEPLHIPAGSGFEFQCHYDNPGTDTVHWGFSAADEMCQIAYVFTPGDASRTCDVVASGHD
jgi:hypothetical protein